MHALAYNETLPERPLHNTYVYQPLFGQQHLNQENLFHFTEITPSVDLNTGDFACGTRTLDNPDPRLRLSQSPQQALSTHLSAPDAEPSSSPDCGSIPKCDCICCTGLGTNKNLHWTFDTPKFRHSLSKAICRYIGCAYKKDEIRYPGGGKRILDSLKNADALMLAEHEQSHFGKRGQYCCREEGCSATTKKFSDLRRHYRGSHCINAQKFPCTMIGCKYGGDNGFTRKDKLKSHYRNAHQGKLIPGKYNQPIKMKATAPQTIKPKPDGDM